MLKPYVAVVALSIPICACVTTQEMPLSANVWKIQTDAGGLLFVGQASSQTLKRAAELTLKQGYTHFRIADAAMNSGSEFAGYIPGQTNTTVNVMGSTAYGTTTYAPGVALRRPTAQASATVIMYHSNDPEAKNALDAEAILRAQNQ